MGAPNILWIVTTQWRAQALGHAGDANARTPCLDALAARSVVFAQAVTPHPFGPFARAALLTGRASPANGVRDYFDPLPAGSRTIAHDMQDRGYGTAFFGKWHLGRRDPAWPLVGRAAATAVVPPPGRGGFEFWEGFDGGFLLNDPWLHGTRLPVPVQLPGYQSDVLTGLAAEWIAARGRERGAPIGGDRSPDGSTGRPWFCVVSLETPHPPYDAPAAGVKPRPPADLILAANVPRLGEVESRARRELAGYYAHLEATDRSIGALVGALPRAAEPGYHPTIVVFTSVHGDMHGSHGLFRKGWPHEESVRVPLLVCGLPSAPGAVQVGRSGAAVSLSDLPGLTRAWADGAGAALPPLPSHAEISMPVVVALPHQCDRVWQGIRSPTRKLVWGADPAAPPWLYFDLEQDPGEMRNLAHDPARSAEMAALRALWTTVDPGPS
jgi:arylsulfatase A-like enzyme